MASDFLQFVAAFGLRPGPRTVLIDTPVQGTHVPWNAEKVHAGEMAISGTHTNLLFIAERFLAEGWVVTVTGNVVPSTSSNGRMHFLTPQQASVAFACGGCNATAAKRPVDWASPSSFWCGGGGGPQQIAKPKRPAKLDLIVTSSIISWPTFSKCSTRRLAVLMDSPIFFPPSFASSLVAYCEQQRAADPGFTVHVFSFTAWGKRVWLDFGLRKSAAAFKTMASRPSVYFHHVGVWLNPLRVAQLDDTARLALPRREEAFLFPACLERGGIVAARVWALARHLGVLKAGSTSITFATYKPPPPVELHAIRSALSADGGEIQLLPGVQFASLSKADLAREMHSSGFFVYGLASSTSEVHLDTFANVVAESLAAGLLVLAPPVAALRKLYEGLVTFVKPVGGVHRATLRALRPPKDSSLNSNAMDRLYVEAIRMLMANATRRAELRARGMREVRERFSDKLITKRTYALLQVGV